MMKDTRTSDLHVAAFLLALGYPLDCVEGDGRLEFVFLNVPDGTVSGYFGGKDMVSARQFANALRDLKGLTLQRPRMR